MQNFSSEVTYQQVKVQTDELIEHINNERAEISNVKEKLTTQTLENIVTTTSSTSTIATPTIREEEEQQQERTIEQGSRQAPEMVSVVQVSAANSEGREEKEKEEEEGNEVPASPKTVEQLETNWLNQVITK